MAQHDYIIANQSGAAFRSDLNNGLAAIVSQNSGAAQPSTTYAYQWWADTTTGLLKLRNAANNAWITIGTLADANLGHALLASPTFTGTPAAPTASVGTNTTQLATTAFVLANAVDVTGDTMTGNITVPSLNGGPLAGFRNRIINGEFAIAQRATTFASGANNDDAYTLDRWYILSDGNDAIDVTRETSVVPANQKYAIALDVETANKKFGIAQIIESDNCIGLTGGTVTLSFKAKVSATTKLDNVKAAIVAWSGTADTVTSDIISEWGAEGTNPTLIANATYENTPANLSVTTSYATYSVTASVDTASTTNIIVFIWSDVTDTTAGDFLYVTDVQIEAGPVATPFERRPIVELSLCQRYFEKSYPIASALGAVTTLGAWESGSLSNTNFYDFGRLKFTTRKRATPTITLWSADGTEGALYNLTASANQGNSRASNISDTGARIDCSNAAMTLDNAFSTHWAATAEL